MKGRLSVLVAICLFVLVFRACLKPENRSEDGGPRVNPLEDLLRTPATATPQEGVAVAALVDTSGSMNDDVKDAGGQPQKKIEIARRCLTGMVGKMDDFVREHQDRKLVVAVYEFSSRDRGPSCRLVVPMGKPDRERTADAVKRMIPDGGTPIGDAMIQAKRDLDATDLTRRHILVVTDGQNNKGYSPGDVADVLSRDQSGSRVALYFVAFDIEAKRFNSVKDAGGLVLEAANEPDLARTLDFILTGKILVEQPQ
jgi:Mg-chelatase subunit ChlD